MKKKVLKIVVALCLILVIVNLFGRPVLASNATVVNEIGESLGGDDIMAAIWDGIGTAIDGVVGLLTIVIRIPLLLIVMALQAILTGVSMLGGSNIEGILTPDDLFFNKVGLTNIDFFDLTGNAGVIQTIRVNVATWYYVLRILAIIVLLAVLIYIGIRMAISTIASDQAKYKGMLMDWIASFALVFLLNYIIMFTIEANNALIGLLEIPVRTKIGSGITTQLAIRSAVGVATVSWGSLIVYAMLVGMTTAFLFSYVRRMLTIGFLIIISPLITITYSIDKVKDGKAQALNNWLKEFMFNVLIQPFHCIIYIVFVSSAIDLLSWEGSIPKMVLAILCMSFIWKAEKIVKQIFGFGSASSLGETVASMAVVKQIGETVAKAGSAGGKVVGKTAFGKNIGNRVSNSKAGKAAKSFSETKLGEFSKAMLPVGAGAVAAGYEVGLNSSANAAQVGLQTYKTVNALMSDDPKAAGSKQNVQASEKDLEKYASLIANNNNFAFQNYQTDATHKSNMKAYAQSLIGTNMDMLNNDIQRALRDLRRVNPTDYDPHTAAGMTHLKDLQDMALSGDLDFNDPSTNPLGHSWTAEEKQVVTAIQIRNLANAVNNTHTQYKAAGSSNPNMDIDTYIDSL